MFVQFSFSYSKTQRADINKLMFEGDTDSDNEDVWIQLGRRVDQLLDDGDDEGDDNDGDDDSDEGLFPVGRRHSLE